MMRNFIHSVFSIFGIWFLTMAAGCLLFGYQSVNGTTVQIGLSFATLTEYAFFGRNGG